MRLPATVRRQIILDAAIRVANRDGLLRTYWTNVAPECEVETSASTIRSYFPRLAELWDAISRDPRFTGDRMGYQPQ